MFRLTTNAALTTLFAFNFLDGAYPFGTLLQGDDGLLYGTTDFGGTNGDGTIFSMTTNGALTTLASFNNLVTGGFPQTGLIRGQDGNFYGATASGGLHSFGTIFQMTTNGALTTLLNFAGTNGITPGLGAALVEGSDGNIYGTALDGGLGYNGYPQSGDGVVFKLGSGARRRSRPLWRNQRINSRRRPGPPCSASASMGPRHLPITGSATAARFLARHRRRTRTTICK